MGVLYFTFRCCIYTHIYALHTQYTFISFLHLFHTLLTHPTVSLAHFVSYICFTFHRNPFFTFAQLGGGVHGMRKSCAPPERNFLFFVCVSLFVRLSAEWVFSRFVAWLNFSTSIYIPAEGDFRVERYFGSVSMANKKRCVNSALWTFLPMT